MSLWTEMNTASFSSRCASLASPSGAARCGAISIATYGAAAAKSQNDSAPWRWSSTETARVSERMPVTLEAAEKDPMRSGRSAWRTSSRSSWARSMRPSASSWMVTTSAMDSRHGSSLEWCSYGPMNTTGRSAAGIWSRSPKRSSSSAGRRRPSTSTSLWMAPVDPDPAKMTTWSAGSAPTAAAMMARASSRKREVWRPVPDDSVCVLA